MSDKNPCPVRTIPPCVHAEEVRRLREENRHLMQSNLELLDEQKTTRRDLLLWTEYGHKRGIDVVDLFPRRSDAISNIKKRVEGR